MARDLSAGLAVETTSSVLRPITLLEMLFDSAPLRFWTGIGSFVWGAKTFTGSGQVIGISDYNETQSLEANGIIISASGIPSSEIAVALNEDYQGRIVRIYFGTVTSAGILTGEPYQMFSGFMDVMEISEGGDTCSISISAENKMVILSRKKLRRYTPEDQKERFAGDKGLDFVPILQDKEIVWKGKN